MADFLGQEDILALFGDDPAAAQMQARALADAMQRRRAAGTIATVIGGPFAKAGQAFLGEAEQAQGDLTRAGQYRGQQALLRSKAAQDQAQFDASQRAASARHAEEIGLRRQALEQDAYGYGQDANGGGFIYNKKDGTVTPLSPNTAPRPGSGLTGGRPNLPGKPTDKQKAAVAEANQSMSEIDLALGALDKNPGAYGGAGNYVSAAVDQVAGVPGQALTSRRFSDGETQARNFVSNVVSQIINQRAGANVTLREELRQKFLPSDFDSLDNVKQKLKDLKALEAVKYEVQSNGALKAPEGVIPSGPSPDVKAKRASRVAEMKAAGRSAQEILATLKAEGLDK